MESYIYRYRELGLSVYMVQIMWTKSCFFFLGGGGGVLDMVFNKVQFSQLVINEYVQLWYQLLIQIILYHGNPNWKLLISWLYMILLIHEYWVISYFADSGLYVFRLFKQHVTGLQFLWNSMCLFLIHMDFFMLKWCLDKNWNMVKLQIISGWMHYLQLKYGATVQLTLLLQHYC